MDLNYWAQPGKEGRAAAGGGRGGAGAGQRCKRAHPHARGVRALAALCRRLECICTRRCGPGRPAPQPQVFRAPALQAPLLPAARAAHRPQPLPHGDSLPPMQPTASVSLLFRGRLCTHQGAFHASVSYTSTAGPGNVASYALLVCDLYRQASSLVTLNIPCAT